MIKSRAGKILEVLDLDLQSKAIEEFGTTYIWSEAGFMFPDGVCLDLSGRIEGGGGMRAYDHRVVNSLVSDTVYNKYSSGDRTSIMYEFCVLTGAIRIKPECPGILTFVMPTRQQFRALKEMWPGVVYVDADDKLNGRIDSSKFYDISQLEDWLCEIYEDKIK